MPDYGYICEDCGNFHAINTIANRGKTECPNCGKDCERDVEYELNSGFDLNVGTDHERWSISMGVPPSQVNDFRKRFPGSTYDDRGRLLIKNRKDKLRQCRERGMCELDNIKD
jgi:putative FmdB family regulatory protein